MGAQCRQRRMMKGLGRTNSRGGSCAMHVHGSLGSSVVVRPRSVDAGPVVGYKFQVITNPGRWRDQTPDVASSDNKGTVRLLGAPSRAPAVEPPPYHVPALVRYTV
eukprot:190016-Chlamydomonas_euryale.AAC.2